MFPSVAVRRRTTVGVAVALATAGASAPGSASAATLVAPPDGATFVAGQQMRMAWTLAPGERGARLHVARDLSDPDWNNPAGGGEPLLSRQVDESVPISPGASPGTIYWRLCVLKDGLPDDQCAWSETRRYVISAQPQCRDKIDNDGDGKTDRQDRSCLKRPNGPSEAAAVPDCYDGVDNDGDGRTDYGRDPGCRSNADRSEVNRRPKKKHRSPRGSSGKLSIGSARAASDDFIDEVAEGLDGAEDSGVITCLRFGSRTVGCRTYVDFDDGGRCTQNVVVAGSDNRPRIVALTESERDVVCD